MENQNLNEEIITDVSVSAREYIKQYFSKKIKLLVVLGVIWIVLLIFFLNYFTVLYIPLIVFFLLYAFVYTKIRHEFMRQFAERNNFSYESVGALMDRTGAIFNKGRSQKLEDLITGKFNNYKFELYNYQYTEGSGKNSHTYFFTVFQIHFDHAVPHLMLTRKVFSIPQMYASNFLHGQSLRLEGDFNSKFSVTVEKEFEIEALQILTPEFMQDLMLANKFSFEFFNEDLYIYRSGFITKKDDLHLMHQLTNFLINKLSQRLARMSKSVKAMHEQGNSL